MRYHHGLMQMILIDKAQIAKAVNATVISLDEASQGYRDFDKCAAKKFVIDPHRSIKAEATPPDARRRPACGAHRF
jgi:glutathione-independent formaldehyde dehydrogenase